MQLPRDWFSFVWNKLKTRVCSSELMQRHLWHPGNVIRSNNYVSSYCFTAVKRFWWGHNFTIFSLTVIVHHIKHFVLNRSTAHFLIAMQMIAFIIIVDLWSLYKLSSHYKFSANEEEVGWINISCNTLVLYKLSADGFFPSKNSHTQILDYVLDRCLPFLLIWQGDVQKDLLYVCDFNIM